MSSEMSMWQYTCKYCGGKSPIRADPRTCDIEHTDECFITWMRREEDLAAGRITLEDIENERKAKAEAKAKAYVADFEAKFKRYQAFVAEKGISWVGISQGYVGGDVLRAYCNGCKKFSTMPAHIEHLPECIVAEARAAVAKENSGG